MGIFTGKAGANAEENLNLSPIEEEIEAKLAKSGFLAELDRFLDEQAAAEPWLTECQGYYDSLLRVVKIHEDLLAIGWKQVVKRTFTSGSRVDDNDMDKDVRLHFTEYGYIPLHNHETPGGNEDVTIDRILFLWGIIVRNRMAAKWPKCSFSSVYQNLGEAAFSYKVPAKEWKDWF